jgi:predicted nucleic acid-binding protein
MTDAIADTSVFIAAENGRPLRAAALPDRLAISVVTLGELRAGVLAAPTLEARDRRLAALTAAQALDPLPIDEAVAAAWARLRVELRERDLRMPVNDSWIAATAIAHGVAVVTQDSDFDDVPGLTVIVV